MSLTAQSFSDLYRDYGAALKAYAVRMTKGSNYAEDVAQDAWTAAWKSRDTFDGSKGVWGWLAALVRRAWYQHLNPFKQGAAGQQRRVPGPSIEALPDNYDAPTPPPQPKAASAIFVRRAVSRLSETRRSIVTMHYARDMNAADIGKARGTSRQATEQLIGKSLADLRKLLSPPIDCVSG